MSKPKQKELTVGEVKKMIYKEIEKKKKSTQASSTCGLLRTP
jgi:hypothetical protein